MILRVFSPTWGDGKTDFAGGPWCFHSVEIIYEGPYVIRQV